MSKGNPNHKTVSICGIDIDENIAELMAYVWLADIKTANSCENNQPNMYTNDTCIWINFCDEVGFSKFIKIVLLNVEGKTQYDGNDSFYERVTSHQQVHGYWKYDVVPMIYNENMDLQRDVNISYSIRFPGCDYGFVLEQFREYNHNMNC